MLNNEDYYFEKKNEFIKTKEKNEISESLQQLDKKKIAQEAKQKMEKEFLKEVNWKSAYHAHIMHYKKSDKIEETISKGIKFF